ncbi:DNRLRE domain-containing protein [Paenibacillus oenotherae]|nr:DNRLRE domain-containing protein [Paenibacillus oenotherae]
MYKILNAIVINMIIFSLLFSGIVLANEQKVSKDITSTKIEKPLPDSVDKKIEIDKELISERSSNSKSYLMNDGSTTVVINTYSVHYEKNSGEWADINPILVSNDAVESLEKKMVSKNISRQMDRDKRLPKEELAKKAKKKSYVAPYVPFTAELPYDINDGYTMGKEADSLTLVPVGSTSSVGVVNLEKGNKVSYKNVWKNTDVELAIINDGIKETMFVATPDSPETFSFKIVGNLKDDFSSGNLQILPPWVEDADGKFQYLEQNIRTEGNQKYIDIHIPKDQLKYPIVIDPTVVTIGNSKDTAYDATNPYDAGYGASERFRQHNVMKTLMKFDLSFVPSNAVIKSAELKLRTGVAVDLGSSTPIMTLNRVTSSWNEYTTNATNAPSYSDFITNIYVANFKNGFDRIVFGTTITANLMTAVSNWVNGTWPNEGFIMNWSAASSSDLWILSREFGDAEYTPKLVLNYNVPSSKPQVTYPNGGEVLDGAATIYWNAAIDPDNTQNTIKYQVQLSANGGSTWSDIVGLTNPAVTQYPYDFSSIPATNNALIRIRAYDGEDYGEWDQSDTYFTIKHNQAPLAPTGLTPGNATSSSPHLISVISPILNWTFVDPDVGDYQTAYQVELYSGSTLVHDSGWIASSIRSYTVPIPLLRNSLYNWRVRTKDTYGAVSNLSSKAYIKINSIPTVSFSSYSDGQNLPNNNLDFTWLYNDLEGQAQAAYKIQGSTDNWTNLMYDTGIVSGSALSHHTPALANGEWDFRISVYDGMEWSDWAYRTDLKLPNSFEPNDTSATAYPILYNNNYSTLISSSTDVDWFVYSPVKAGVDEVVFNVPAGRNYDIFIYDKDLNLVASGQRDASGIETLLYKVSSGPNIKYFIKIVGAGGAFSTTSTYTLSVKRLEMNFQTIYQYDDNGNITSKTTTLIN